MATLTVNEINHTGLDDAAVFTAAAGGGDTFVNTGNCFLYVKNGGGGSITVTVDSVLVSSTGKDDNVAVAVGAGVNMLIGSFPKNRFDQTDGTVNITYSGVTTVTVAVFRLNPTGI